VKSYLASAGFCGIVELMTINLRFGKIGLILVGALIFTRLSHADCTLTNVGIVPLNELGMGTYSNNVGGLYPGGLNTRPAAHEAAGIAIAQNLQPLDATGTVNTNTGKIGLLSLGMSNVTMEWATKGTNTFLRIATNDPALNPRVAIADGAISGMDAPQWTNYFSPNWNTVVTNRLPAAGLTTNQVQVVWLKQALAGPTNYGAFPAHARTLQAMEETILRNAKARFPNLKIAYLSSRTRAYTSNPGDLSPEPFAFECGFAARWVIEDQLNKTNNLNYDPTNGPVVAPWLSWGPYLWANGTTPRGDGTVAVCSDVEAADYTHPTTNGHVAKVAVELLTFFKTDPTATPWFLKKNPTGSLTTPSCAPTASTNLGLAPLTVNFSAHAFFPSGAVPRDAKWTFEDGEYSTNLNPAKVFSTPGIYHARLTVTATNGENAAGSVAVTVGAGFDAWRAVKFTPAEFANTNISGASANPDGDTFPNLLEYAMGLEPKTNTPASTFAMSCTNGVFSLTFPHYKFATDAPLVLESSADLGSWSPVTVTQSLDLGALEFLSTQLPTTNTAKFFRLQSALH
jgi:hypothetical protein